MKRSVICLVLALAGLGAAQAGQFDSFLKGLIKQKMQPQEQPAQPAQQAEQQSPEALLVQSLFSGRTSEQEEVRIGQQIAGNLLGVAPLVRDDRLQTYVNQVGRWVALQSDRPDLVWHFGVIESDDINAFAAPGGYIFLTKGLYRMLNNEAELAGVLGHEIGHVMRKHHLKVLQKSQGIAAVGALLQKKAKNESQLVQNLIGNGAEIVARGLDKDAEFEADRIGLVLAARAGYDAYGLPTVLDAIGHVAKSDKSLALLFKTHPQPEARLNQLSEAVAARLDGVPEGPGVAGRFYRLR